MNKQIKGTSMGSPVSSVIAEVNRVNTQYNTTKLKRNEGQMLRTVFRNNGYATDSLHRYAQKNTHRNYCPAEWR